MTEEFILTYQYNALLGCTFHHSWFCVFSCVIHFVIFNALSSMVLMIISILYFEFFDKHSAVAYGRFYIQFQIPTPTVSLGANYNVKRYEN